MIRKKTFGSTGHDSTVTLFGVAGLARVTQDDADCTLQVLLQYGVNHIDIAAIYGDAELRVDRWMKRHREDFFLATKTGERTYAEAREQIRHSLERLQTDHVDLIQLHALVHPDEWEVAMGEGGALEAAVEARDEGLVRFIGVTGHNWTIAAMHKRSLKRFPFDSVMLPCNFPMLKYHRDFEAILNSCSERGGNGADNQVDRPRSVGDDQTKPHDLLPAACRAEKYSNPASIELFETQYFFIIAYP